MFGTVSEWIILKYVGISLNLRTKVPDLEKTAVLVLLSVSFDRSRTVGPYVPPRTSILPLVLCY